MLFAKVKTYYRLSENYFKYFIFLIIPILASCALDLSKTNNNSKSSNEKPIVLTTFTILADMASNVAGDQITVKSITKLGAEVHGYQPTPSDLVLASKANLIIENGFGLELWAEKFTKSLNNVPSVILSDGMKPLLIEGDVYSGKPNPHVWMSPIRAITYIDNLVDAFSNLKPDSKHIFQKNAQSYKQQLIKLDKELRYSLSTIPVQQRILVTCEGAFSYLAHDYGMQEYYLWPVNAESQVTPRRMSNLIAKISSKKVPAIFCESTVSPKHQIEVAEASGTSFGGTFYVDSLSGPSGPAPTYLMLQRHNLRLIQKGLTANHQPSIHSENE